MSEHPQAGARVRIVIEDTVESLSDNGDWTTTGGIHLTGVTPHNATTTILEPGWQPGDIVNDGHSDLVRIRREDGVHLWQRVDNGQPVYDDETSLASLTVVHSTGVPENARVTFTITQVPEPAELQQELARVRRDWPGGRR